MKASALFFKCLLVFWVYSSLEFTAQTMWRKLNNCETFVSSQTTTRAPRPLSLLTKTGVTITVSSGFKQAFFWMMASWSLRKRSVVFDMSFARSFSKVLAASSSFPSATHTRSFLFLAWSRSHFNHKLMHWLVESATATRLLPLKILGHCFDPLLVHCFKIGGR